MHSIATVLSGAKLAAGHLATVASVTRSAAPSRCSSTQRRLGAEAEAVQRRDCERLQPSRLSRSAARRAPDSGIEADGRLCGAQRRPPRAATSRAARGQAERGWRRQHRELARGEMSHSSSPTPKHKGSPLARTTTGGRAGPPGRAASPERPAPAGARRRGRGPWRGGARRRPAPRRPRSRRARRAQAASPASPIRPHGARVRSGARGASMTSALTAAAASALPPRRPRSAIWGIAGRWQIKPPWPRPRHEADREGEHQGGRAARPSEHLEQAEQRGRRIADRDDRAGQIVLPELHRGGRARGRRCAAASAGARARAACTRSRCRRAGGPGGCRRRPSSQSTSTGRPAASAPRPAATASSVQARSARMSGMAQAWIRRSATGCIAGRQPVDRRLAADRGERRPIDRGRVAQIVALRHALPPRSAPAGGASAGRCSGGVVMTVVVMMVVIVDVACRCPRHDGGGPPAARRPPPRGR